MTTIILILFMLAAAIFGWTLVMLHQRNLLKAEAETLLAEIEDEDLRAVILDRKDLWR